MELTLTEEQVEVLRMMVQKDIHELLMEIANTDSRSYREQLKTQETMLAEILERLTPTTGETPTTTAPAPSSMSV